MEQENDLGRRVASIETELRGMREEIQLNRRRYHDLSSSIAPMILEATDLARHEMDIRLLQTAMERLRGAWMSVVVMASVLSAVIAGGWTIVTHFTK